MKKTLIVILSLLSILLFVSCAIGSASFPDWMIGTWKDSKLGRELNIERSSITNVGDGFSTKYSLWFDTLDVYETSENKIAKFTLKPYLRITATFDKKTGILNLLDYDGIIGGFYTKK